VFVVDLKHSTNGERDTTQWLILIYSNHGYRPCNVHVQHILWGNKYT